MRKDWPLRFCKSCGGMITHYSRGGELIQKLDYAKKQACNNPACLSAIKTVVLRRKKKCWNCTEMISHFWPNGSKKDKGKFEEQKFHSNECYWDHKTKVKPPRPMPKIYFKPTTPIERFISAP